MSAWRMRRSRVFLDLVAFPLGAFRKYRQRVVAGIVLLVANQESDQLLQIHLEFGDAAADGGDVGGIERGVSGVAPKHPEKPDALMRTHRGALALDGIHGARDSGRESDAVFRVSHIVVHGLWHGEHLNSLAVELG